MYFPILFSSSEIEVVEQRGIYKSEWILKLLIFTVETTSILMLVPQLIVLFSVRWIGTFLLDSVFYSALFILAYITLPQVYVFTPGAVGVESATGASLQYFLTGCGSRITATTEN